MTRSLLDLARDPLERRQRTEAAVLFEEQTRHILAGAAPIFREQALRFRGAVPVNVINDPGVITSRKLKLVDIAEAEIDERGTGGTFDDFQQEWDDRTVLRIKRNVKITDLDAQTASRAGGFDPWRQLGVLAGEQVAQGLNKVIVKTVRGSKGITTVSGSQSVAGASWKAQGNFYKSVILARGKLRAANIDPDVANLAVITNPENMDDAEQTFASTATPQTQLALSMLPGGRYTSSHVTAGDAWFYANNPNIMELEVYEDLSVIPLPRGDEESRSRVRTSVAFQIPKPKGIVKVTGIA